MSNSAPHSTSFRGTLAVAGIALAIALPGYRFESGGRAPIPGLPPVSSAQEFRYEGEFGLFVRHVDDRLDVHWLTPEAAPGLLRVYLDGEVIQERTTSHTVAHLAEIELRKEVDDDASIVLEYGSMDEPEQLYRTRVYLGPVERDRNPVYEGVDSLYVVGDSHGEFDSLTTLLRNTGLIDAQLRWTGGSRQLVMLGDLMDRGHDVTRLLWFIYGLEREAAAAGGRVHTVLGNHEIMVMTQDLRYVSGKERQIAGLYQVDYSELFDPHTSVLGRWLASKPALIRIDDVLLSHGGVGPRFSRYGIEDYQDSLGAFIGEELFLRWEDDEFLSALVQEATLDSAGFMRRWDFFRDPESVFWYRDLVATDTLEAYIESILKHFRSNLHVVGHTPRGMIEEFYEGRVIAVDMEAAATELLLLVRKEDGWERLKYGLRGPPEPLTTTRTHMAPNR